MTIAEVSANVVKKLVDKAERDFKQVYHDKYYPALIKKDTNKVGTKHLRFFASAYGLSLDDFFDSLPKPVKVPKGSEALPAIVDLKEIL